MLSVQKDTIWTLLNVLGSSLDISWSLVNTFYRYAIYSNEQINNHSRQVVKFPGDTYVHYPVHILSVV